MAFALVILLAVIIVIAGFRAPVDASGVKPLVSAYTLVLALFLIYFLIPACLILLNNGEYIWAVHFQSPGLLIRTVGCAIAALVAFLYGYRLHASRVSYRVPEPSSISGETRDHRDLRALPIFLMIAGIMLRLYTVFATGGLRNIVVGLSGATRKSNDLADLSSTLVGIRNLSSIADVGATWLLLWSLRNNKRIKWPSIIFIGMLCFSFATVGKRLTLILPILAVVIGIHRYKKHITTRAAPAAIALVLGLGMGSLLFRIFLPAQLSGVSIDLNDIQYSHGSILLFYFYSLEFSTVEMLGVSMAGRGHICAMFGGPLGTFVTTNLTPVTYFIPRLFWSGKPSHYYDLSYGVSSLVNGNNLEDAKVGYASTLVGTSYILLGMVGVIGILAMLGMLASRIDVLLRHSDWTIAKVLSYSFVLVLIFQFFRQGTIAWTLIVSIVNQSGFILGGCWLIYQDGKTTPNVGSSEIELAERALS